MGEDLAAVRALFQRLDADADGRLDRREADHGGVDANALPRSDGDRDGLLDFQEFCVARQRELSRRRLPAGLDLIAESTRIQARWRAQAAQAERERAVAAAEGRPAAQQPLPAREPGGTPAARAAPTPAGPAQQRLSGAIGSSAALTAERARRAQLLVELRRRRRGPQ